MSDEKMIGIVGGVGPYAGFCLVEKVFGQTNAARDQEHLSVALLSMPRHIEDRTSFLMGETDFNPALSISDIIKKLEQMGAEIIGIACNTSHAPRIYNVLLKKLEEENSRVKLVHIIDEVVDFISVNYPGIRNVGVLATTGAYKAGVYKHSLQNQGFNVVLPDEAVQEDVVQKCIYDPEYGIKAKSNPVTEKARKGLLEAVGHLRKKGAEAIVLGCTELSLAITEKAIGGAVILDSTMILARALIREAAPHKLKEL